MFFVYKSEENRKQNQTDNRLFFINSQTTVYQSIKGLSNSGKLFFLLNILSF